MGRFQRVSGMDKHSIVGQHSTRLELTHVLVQNNRTGPVIILLGGSGYVGSAFARHLAAHNVPCRIVRRRDCDYTQRLVLQNLIRELQPAFLINCAGYVGKPNIDTCELHKTECLFTNAVLPGLIRQACEDTATPWGHVSSGCIHTGSRSDGRGFTEADPPNFTFRQNNCSFYSGTKALGEEVLAGAANCYIWRLRLPFNEVDHPRNYLTKLMRYDRLLAARNSLSQLDEAVQAACACWQRRLPFGVYNLTNPGAITTHEIVALIQASGVLAKEFRFFQDENEFLRCAVVAPRSNCVLDTTKLETADIRLTEVHDAIAQALRQWKAAGGSRMMKKL